MANPEHLAILKQGVEKWNAWRKEHEFFTSEDEEWDPDIQVDLTLIVLEWTAWREEHEFVTDLVDEVGTSHEH